MTYKASDRDSKREFSYKAQSIIKPILAKIQKLPEVCTEVDFNKVIDLSRSIIIERKFNQVLDYLERIINEFFDLSNKQSFTKLTEDFANFLEIGTPGFSGQDITIEKIDNFAKKIVALFESHGAAYWLDTSQRPYQFFPCASQEQGEAIREAIDTLHQDGMNHATTHLRQAAEHIRMKQYGDSVADSIHAVESVAGEIDSKGNKTLGDALKSLRKEGFFPDKASLLKEALNKLHGYANQPGIRHGSQEGSTVEVGLDEAMLMYGACASFAAYLTRKNQSRQGRQVPTSPPATLG